MSKVKIILNGTHGCFEYNEKDTELFRSLIIKNKQLYLIVDEEYDNLLWKDFLLYFKYKANPNELGEMYTPKISNILRNLLHIDQDLHVRKGIKLTFREWLELY